MFIPGSVSHEELVDQIVRMGDELQQMRLDNATLKAQVGVLQGNKGKGMNGKKSKLRDFNNVYPEHFNPKKESFTT